MIAYFDTSALIPLIVEEPTSNAATRLWQEATRVVSVRLIYPEARAALARAHRTERLSTRRLRLAVAHLDALDRRLDHVEVTPSLAYRAGQLAEDVGVRGYDAVHLAAAVTITDRDLVLVCTDRALVGAAAGVGMATAALDPTT